MRAIGTITYGSGVAAAIWALTLGLPILSAVLMGVFAAIVVSLLLLVTMWLWFAMVSTYTDLMCPGSTAELRRARRAAR